VNHPVFSPDGRSIAVTADLAAVSPNPISLPLFIHSVRLYGDIDPEDVKKFHRVTHREYDEYSTHGIRDGRPPTRSGSFW
jgi:hypothetical protein